MKPKTGIDFCYEGFLEGQIWLTTSCMFFVLAGVKVLRAGSKQPHAKAREIIQLIVAVEVDVRCQNSANI